MSEVWALTDETIEINESGGELTPELAERYFNARDRAVADLLKISDREVGDISTLTEYLAISFDSDIDPDVAEDAGIAGYLMLREACDLPPN